MDGISPKTLKETFEQISTPLAHVSNLSLQEGIVPLEWKEANIIIIIILIIMAGMTVFTWLATLWRKGADGL